MFYDDEKSNELLKSQPQELYSLRYLHRKSLFALISFIGYETTCSCNLSTYCNEEGFSSGVNVPPCCSVWLKSSHYSNEKFPEVSFREFGLPPFEMSWTFLSTSNHDKMNFVCLIENQKMELSFVFVRHVGCLT